MKLALQLVVALLISTVGSHSSAQIPLYGFEQTTESWQAGTAPNYSDSNAVTLGRSALFASLGDESLELNFGPGKAIFFVERPEDWLDGAKLEFDLFDPEGSVEQVAVALSTGSDWVWHESTPVSRAARVATYSYDLHGSDYKTAATDWHNEAAVADLNDVKRLALVLFARDTGVACLDNVRLVSSGDTGVRVKTEALAGNQATSITTQPPPRPLVRQSTVAQGAKFEFDLSVEVPPENPFRSEVAPTVTFTAPSGAEIPVQAFWYQDYDPNTLQPVGAPGYRVRFTPTEVGTWTTDQGFGFGVTESDAHGFLRVDADNPRYLAFDDGTPFFGIGLNIAWATSATTTLADYERWFDALAAHGGNLARLWFAPWGFALEWDDTGLGDYTNRLDRAWLLDQVLQMAEARGIRVILVLTNHGQFSETTNPEWRENPYNAANGGPCDVPECFATNETAKTYFKQRLAYIAARYAYSPSILAWEWWNEVNFTPIGRADLKSWLEEMNAYLSTVDPYHHLTTNSYAGGSGGDLWDSPAVDLIQFHLYDTLDPCLTAGRSFGRLADSADKPVVYGEYGFGTGGEDASGPDREGVHLHNALWASASSGFATTALYWWWDTLVEPLELWQHYGALSTFLAGEDLSTLTPVKPDKSSGVCANALVSRTHALVWVRGSEYTAQAASDAYTEVLRGGTLPGSDWRYEPEAVTDQSVTLSGLTDGTYTLQSYDPQTASWTGEETVQVAGGTYTLALPPLARDLAFDLSKQ